MPQNRKGPRLALYKRPGRKPVWAIRDGMVFKSTGLTEPEHDKARAALAKYIEETKPTLPRSWTGEALPQPKDYILYYISTTAVDDYPVKIGKAFEDIHRRLSGLQTASPYPLTILAAQRASGALERLIHAEFHSARLQGEWFRRTPELMAHIHRVMNDMPLLYVSIPGFDSLAKSA